MERAMLSPDDLLSRNDFAKAVLTRLTQLGVKFLPRYDELSFCFFADVSAQAATGKSGHLRLEQWYERYKEALLDGRGPLAIDALARYWVQLMQHAEAQYALDTSRMLPLVRSRFDFAVTALRSGSHGQNDAVALDQLAWQPLAEHLVLALAEDSPHAWRYVTTAQLAHAGLTWEAALELAKKNLCRVEPVFRQEAPFVRSDGNTWIPATRQSPHTAAALLWPGLCRSVPVAGTHVAFAPFANSLAIIGSENHAELARLAAMTLSLTKTIADKPLTSIPLVLDGNQWRPWMPPPIHPLHSAIRELWCLHENSIYSEQGKLLKQQHAGDENAPYIASYQVLAATSADGQRSIGTVATWTETLTTLLPKADAVVLTKLLNRAELDANQDAEPQFGVRITIAWRDLASLLGDRLRPQGMYPERFLVSGEDFPQGAQWDGLALAQVSVPPPTSPLAVPGAAPAQSTALPAFAMGAPIAPAHPAIAMNPQMAAPNPPAPLWQPPKSAGKVPIAPSRGPSLWPVLLAVAIPVGFLFLLLLAASVSIYWLRSSHRPSLAQQFPPAAAQENLGQGRARLAEPHNVLRRPPANVEPPARRPPQYVIKLPWAEMQDFPELRRPQVALPRLSYDEQDVMLAGPREKGGRDEFDDRAPSGAWMVGLRIVRGNSWGGAVRSIQPIYQVEDKYHLGSLCGSEGGEAQTEVLAQPGYAIGKIECRAGLVNNAVRLTFCRVKEQGLDPDDSYATQWLGSEGGGAMPAIGGRGEAIVGLSGTYQNDHDIIELQGLVALPLPKVEKSLPKSSGTARRGAATDERRGSGFSEQAPPGGWLVGLRVFQGESWGGAPLAIQPIYQLHDRYVLGARLGKEGGELHQWIAPPGYAVGEIWADQGLVVHRLQLRYQQVSGGALDPKKSADSPRLGPEGGRQYCLSSDGKPIVGLTVELGGDISSLGLIVAE
jgi:hypothetical protein